MSIDSSAMEERGKRSWEIRNLKAHPLMNDFDSGNIGRKTSCGDYPRSGSSRRQVVVRKDCRSLAARFPKGCAALARLLLHTRVWLLIPSSSNVTLHPSLHIVRAFNNLWLIVLLYTQGTIDTPARHPVKKKQRAPLSLSEEARLVLPMDT